MKGFKPEESFLGETAAQYDEEDKRGDEAETVAFLTNLASGRDCLELAIGTGRIGLPLANTGLRVDGVELSPDMIAVLRGKPGGSDRRIVQGDMTTTDMGRQYGLVYLLFNTIGNVLTQDGQVQCFENAARHMEPDASFVLECRVPTAPKRGDTSFVEMFDLAVDSVHLGASRYDPVTQILDLQHVHIGQGGIRLQPICLRLANPPEFDLMARCGGMELEYRHGGWRGEAFGAASWRHVSVYRKRQP